jgi:hypothetical protein
MFSPKKKNISAVRLRKFMERLLRYMTLVNIQMMNFLWQLSILWDTDLSLQELALAEKRGS